MCCSPRSRLVTLVTVSWVHHVPTVIALPWCRKCFKDTCGMPPNLAYQNLWGGISSTISSTDFEEVKTRHVLMQTSEVVNHDSGVTTYWQATSHCYGVIQTQFTAYRKRMLIYFVLVGKVVDDHTGTVDCTYNVGGVIQLSYLWFALLSSSVMRHLSLLADS